MPTDILDLSSNPDGGEETVVVVHLDGEDITMPASMPAGLVLREIRKNTREGATATGEMDFVERCLGVGQLDRLLDSSMTNEQWRAVVNRVYRIALGQDPDSEANQGNGSTDSETSPG
jgi:hypothetical protein